MNSISRMPPLPSLMFSCSSARSTLSVDQRLHVPDRLEGAVIQIAPVDERRERVDERRAAVDVAGHRARLDPGVALPLAAVGLVVVLHRGEAGHQRPGIAERPQPRIDAIDEAFRGALRQTLHQRARHALEIAVGVQRALAVGLARRTVAEDQIDIGGEVELAATELAHADDDQPLRPAVGIAQHAVTLGHAGLGMLERRLDAAIGQRRQRCQRGLERVDAGQVAPGDDRQRLVSIATQGGLEIRRLIHGRGRRHDLGLRIVQTLVGGQRLKTLGVAAHQASRNRSGPRCVRARPRPRWAAGPWSDAL